MRREINYFTLRLIMQGCQAVFPAKHDNYVLCSSFCLPGGLGKTDQRYSQVLCHICCSLFSVLKYVTLDFTLRLKRSSLGQISYFWCLKVHLLARSLCNLWVWCTRNKVPWNAPLFLGAVLFPPWGRWCSWACMPMQMLSQAACSLCPFSKHMHWTWKAGFVAMVI